MSNAISVNVGSTNAVSRRERDQIESLSKGYIALDKMIVDFLDDPDVRNFVQEGKSQIRKKLEEFGASIFTEQDSATDMWCVKDRSGREHFYF